MMPDEQQQSLVSGHYPCESANPISLREILVHNCRWPSRARLWHGYCRQMPRAYIVEGAYERRLQNILNTAMRVMRQLMILSLIHI